MIRTGKLWSFTLLAFFCVIVWAAPKSVAHELSTSFLHLRVQQSSIEVELDLDVRDIAILFEVDQNGDNKIQWRELEAVGPQIEEILHRTFKVQSKESDCKPAPPVLMIRKRYDGFYAVTRLHYECEASVSLEGLSVSSGLHDLFGPFHKTIAAVTAKDRSSVHTLSQNSPVLKLSEQPQTAFNRFILFIPEGIHHILIGYDHILFLLSLLIPSLFGLDRRGLHLSAVLYNILTVVTAFTVSHSITLTLAATGLVLFDPALIECLIALSIVFVAVENLRGSKPRNRWLTALLFGFVHGFGFANVLSELDIDSASLIPSLLGFNLGVELGQIAVVLLVLPFLYICRNKKWFYPVVVQGGSVIIGLIGLFWFITRLPVF